MSDIPLLSVCMVTFNQESFIAQAIESVLMQKGDFNLRLIIGDDASKDKTGDICKEYAGRNPERISYYRNENNLGPKLNFKRAMGMISGEYVAFCEGDDFWTDPNKLQKQIDFLQKNEGYNICFHQTKVLLKDGRLVNDFMTKIPSTETTVADLVRVGNYIHTPSVVIRNNFVVPEWYWNCPIGDYPLYILAARDGKIKCLNEAMAVYRFGGSFSGGHPAKRRIRSLRTLDELVVNFSGEKIKEGLIKRQKKEFYIFLLIYALLGHRDRNDLKSVIEMPIPSKIRYLLRALLH